MKSEDFYREDFVKKFGKFYKKGTVIFKEGEIGEKMYVIHQGKVKIYRDIDGVERILAVLGKGEFFGEMSILTRRPRSATVEVVEDAIILEMREVELEEFIRAEPSLAIKMMGIMAKRLENANKLIENLMLGDRRLQVLKAFLAMASEMQVRGEGGGWFSFDHREFLARVGAPADVAKGVLVSLKKMGLIEVKEKKVRIKSMVKLKEFVNFLTWSESMKTTYEGEV